MAKFILVSYAAAWMGYVQQLNLCSLKGLHILAVYLTGNLVWSALIAAHLDIGSAAPTGLCYNFISGSAARAAACNFKGYTGTLPTDNPKTRARVANHTMSITILI